MEKISRGMKRAILLIVVFSLFFGFFSSVSANPAPEGFEVDNVLLKLMTKQGDSVSKTIKITNTDSVKQDFIVTENLDFFSVNEQEFSLGAGESKSLEIDFETEKQPGVYNGNILVSSGKEELKIPVILEIETKEVLFDSGINIPFEYSEVYQGGKIAVENKIFNLENVGSRVVQLEYAVRDFTGKTIFSENENIVVENQILTTKLIEIPENVKTGEHILYVIVRYENSVGTSSYFFKIIEKKEELRTGSFSGYWIFIIVLVTIIIVFVIFTKQRDKLFLELEKQHRKELKGEMEKFESQRRLALSKTEKAEKAALERKMTVLKRKLEKKIKEKQKKQKNVFRRLKKQRKKSEMERKLEQWKKQGFNVNEFLKEKKIKGTGRQLKEWKKQGYDTSVLK